ncbi:MAG TPA: PTS sugar transporter subunit IIA [Longimicrobiales bacterium]
MRLREYLRPELIVLDLEARNGAEVIQTLVRRMAEREAVADPAAIEKALLAREAVHTTAMGNGVAVPHATVAGLDGPVVMVAVARDGVRYGPAGLEPVRLFFVLLSPPDRAGLHIKLLARIARLVRHPGLVERLEGAASPDALLRDLERIDAQHV